MRKVILLMLLVIFTAYVNISNASPILVDKIVATVDGKPITLYELRNMANFYKAKNIKELLNKVINDYIVENYAKNVGVYVTDGDIEKYLENIAARNNMSVDEFLSKLKREHIDINYYKEGIRLMLYKIKFARRVFLPSVKISKREIESYYNLHKSEFVNANKEVVLSIISVDSLSVAQRVYKMLKQGAKFEELLNKYSTEKQKTRIVPIEVLNPYLQKEILSLKKGQFTNIIESGGRYYIVKLIKVKKVGNIDSTIRELLIGRQIGVKLRSWLKIARSRSDVEIFLK